MSDRLSTLEANLERLLDVVDELVARVETLERRLKTATAALDQRQRDIRRGLSP